MIFEDLDAWQEARALVREIYVLTRDAQLGRDLGLRSQLERSAVSAMTNIAEGFERSGNQEKLHFYNIARASCGEVRSLLYAAEDSFGHLAPRTTAARLSTVRVGKLVSGLIASTRRRTANVG